MKIDRFEDLKVWQSAHKLSLEISELVKLFPRNEKYDLVGQMRRSARSIPHFTLTFVLYLNVASEHRRSKCQN